MSKQMVRDHAWSDNDQVDQPELEATNGVRFKAIGCLVLGIPLCFTPLAFVGVPLALFSFFTLLTTPALEVVEKNATQGWREEQEQGRDGCGWFVFGCIAGAVLLLGATFLAGWVTLTVQP